MKYFKSEKVTWCTSYIPISLQFALGFFDKTRFELRSGVFTSANLFTWTLQLVLHSTAL